MVTPRVRTPVHLAAREPPRPSTAGQEARKFCRYLPDILVLLQAKEADDLWDADEYGPVDVPISVSCTRGCSTGYEHFVVHSHTHRSCTLLCDAKIVAKDRIECMLAQEVKGADDEECSYGFVETSGSVRYFGISLLSLLPDDRCRVLL